MQFKYLSSLPVNDETEVSTQSHPYVAMQMAFVTGACLQSNSYLERCIVFSTKDCWNLSVSDFVNDIPDYLQEVQVRIFLYLAVHPAIFFDSRLSISVFTPFFAEVSLI